MLAQVTVKLVQATVPITTVTLQVTLTTAIVTSFSIKLKVTVIYILRFS